jgi:hypothetical protein
MRALVRVLLLIISCASSADAIMTNGSVVEFIVYAERQIDVSDVFPGAHVDHTWNNLFIVHLWTNDPDTLIKELRKQLELHSETLQVVIPPFPIAVATQKWIEYNLVWVALMLLLFLTGCACGGTMVTKCNAVRRAIAKPYTPLRDGP